MQPSLGWFSMEGEANAGCALHFGGSRGKRIAQTLDTARDLTHRIHFLSSQRVVKERGVVK